MFQRNKVSAEENEEKVVLTDVTQMDRELEGYYSQGSTLPFTSTISAQELYILKQAGYVPVQVVVGTVVYSMGLKGAFRTLMRALQRGEMPDFSHLQQIAREMALARMNLAAQKLGADGVIAQSFTVQSYADFLEVISFGTAIKKMEGGCGDKGLEVALGV